MGAAFRLMAMLLGLGFLACMVLHKTTGEAIWRQRGTQVLKWGVALALAFFGLLILRRAAIFL